MAAILLSLWTLSVEAAGRVALVIGNSDYRTLPKLQNPSNDAEDIAVALDALDFEVMRGVNVDQAAMVELIDRFATAIGRADVALFFYAGHGFQASAVNFLVPADALLSSPQDVARDTIPLDRVLAAMERSSGLRLVFLDACRDNPLGGALPGSAKDGLARVGTAADFLIAFATQPGNVAYDGLGENSFFTQALLSHISARDQDISDMMIAVRRDVISATGGKQIPWESSSLTYQFQFASGPATGTPETMLYQVAARARDPMLMRLYLDRFPDGAHVADAVRFLGGAASAPDSVERSTPPPADDDLLWQLARQTRIRPLVELYLEQRPPGAYSEDARRLLETLPPEAELGPGRICERLATHPHDATASTAGVPFDTLVLQASAAIAACRKAAEASPDLPHYTALLARAMLAVGEVEEAITLYRGAAERGDLRAIWSLANFFWDGRFGLPKDRNQALLLYEKAAAGGSPDAMINLAYALEEGVGVPQDSTRALSLLLDAADAGSPLATYNLGALAQRGVRGTGASPIEHFRDAARRGEPRAYVAAAELLDKGAGVDPDPREAARMLLFGVASDDGRALRELTEAPEHWSRGTLRAVQSLLKRAGIYHEAEDGLSGPRLGAALDTWRNGGFDPSVLDG